MTAQDITNLYIQTPADQFISFLNAIRKAKTNGDISSISLQSSLCAIIENDIQECRTIGMKGQEMTVPDKNKINSSGRLIACYLLLLMESRSRKELRDKVLLLLEYASYCTSNKLPLIELAAKSASFSFSGLGYSWSMLEVSPSIEMLVYKMAESAEFNMDDPLPMLKVSGNGCFSIRDGIIRMSSSSTDSGVKAFSIGGNCCEIITQNVREHRLKATEVNDIKSLEAFAKNFLINQSLSKRTTSVGDGLVENERYSVRLKEDFTDKNGDRYFTCIPFGVDYDETCEIEEEELSKGIKMSDIVEYLFPEDCICGALLLDKNDPPLFSLRDSYLSYAKKQADQDAASKRKYQAKVVKFHKGFTSDKDRICLISDKGYGGLMKVNGQYEIGELVVVYTQFTQLLGCDLYINMDIPDEYSEDEVSEFIPDDVLSDFVSTPEDAKTSSAGTRTESKEEETNKELARCIGRILAKSKCDSSIERYRLLISSAFVSNLTDDSEYKEWALARAEYLGECLRVAEGLEAKNRLEDFNLTEEESNIIRMLILFSSSEDINVLNNFLTSDKAEITIEKELAKLILISRLSKSMPDEIKSSPDSIREKICTILNVKDHFKASTIRGGGKYGKGELRNVEFKSSYVMSNKTGLPDIDYQGRGQIFEAACAFLNSEGGTVYVGVNNSGDPITDEDYGLQADIKWFSQNYSSLNIKRKHQLGHPIPQPRDLDSYCLFLNDEKGLYFKPNICPYITIEPTPDFDAIRISVVPSPFEIAKLYKDNTWEEGIAYYRDGGETLVMPRQLQEERLMMLRSVGKMEKSILALTDAIDQKKKVLLKGYSSSNSNKIEDRYIVPINLVYNNENLWAYDLENKVFKEFRLSRISSIETENTVYTHHFQKETADVFRWIKPGVRYHVILKITVFALNCLKEEYSSTKNLPAEELYQFDETHWILDTKLQGWGAVVRFYLGLADQIEILPSEDSQELINQINEFRRKNIDPLSCLNSAATNSGNTSSE